GKGSVIDTITYDGFGNVTNETNAANGGRYKWTGREADSETGLQYNRARDYDPKIGRWTSQDPLGVGAGDSNLYRYVNNEPTQFTDPTGMWRLIERRIRNSGKISDLDNEAVNGKKPYSTQMKVYEDKISELIESRTNKKLNIKIDSLGKWYNWDVADDCGVKYRFSYYPFYYEWDLVKTGQDPDVYIRVTEI